jgi:RHS repeat-associated protein
MPGTVCAAPGPPTTHSGAPNTWHYTWDYNRFGNRRNQNLTGGSQGYNTLLTISESTNRVTGTGITRDNTGNMTADGINTFKYDAENRLTQVGNIVATYTYGSGPLRVKKVAGATTTTRYIYSGAKIIAEYVNGSLSKEYVYAGNQLLATHAGGATTYHHSDHLSIRADTDTSAAVTRTSGHLPFGENWYETGGTSKWRFTSYERDSAAEGGLDQAVFRYYKSGWGRFGGPDLVPGVLYMPQSLNRYAYTHNDPINLTDPLGLSPFPNCLLDASVRCSPAEMGVNQMWFCEFIDVQIGEGILGGGIGNCGWVPANHDQILREAIRGVRERLQKAECASLFDKIDTDSVLNNDIRVDTKNAEGNAFTGDDIAATTTQDRGPNDESLPSGSIVINQNGWFITGQIGGRSVDDVFTQQVRQRNGLGNLSQSQVRELVLFHEMVHLNDTSARWDHPAVTNKDINDLIRAKCF